MRYKFDAEQWLPYPVDLVFAFFANPENLPRLMLPWQKARIEEASFTAPSPRTAQLNPSRNLRTIAAGEGTRMILSFRPFPYSPIRLRWEAEIDEFAWDNHFADLQLHGPFAYWHHRHTVTPKTHAAEVGTLLRDEVEYELPLRHFGNLANNLFVAPQLRSTFEFRHNRTRELLRLMSSQP